MQEFEEKPRLCRTKHDQVSKPKRKSYQFFIAPHSLKI